MACSCPPVASTAVQARVDRVGAHARTSAVERTMLHPCKHAGDMEGDKMRTSASEARKSHSRLPAGPGTSAISAGVLRSTILAFAAIASLSADGDASDDSARREMRARAMLFRVVWVCGLAMWMTARWWAACIDRAGRMAHASRARMARGCGRGRKTAGT